MLFDELADRDPAEVRRRSPLLFTVIIATASYYNIIHTAHYRLYSDLLRLVNELLAPDIVSPRPDHMTTDLLKSLTTLLLYKPVQYYPGAPTDLQRAEQVSKINKFASSSLSGLSYRGAQTILSTTVTHTFAAAFLAAYPSQSIPRSVIDRLRTWYWILIVETHGSLQAGRLAQSRVEPDIVEALKTTRLFASLSGRQAGDVRLAASVELFALAASWPEDLGRLNRELELHEQYWFIPLQRAQIDGDSHNLSLFLFADFLRLALNISSFTRKNSEQALTAEERDHIRVAVDSAERILFSVSVKARNLTASRRPGTQTILLAWNCAANPQDAPSLARAARRRKKRTLGRPCRCPIVPAFS